MLNPAHRMTVALIALLLACGCQTSSKGRQKSAPKSGHLIVAGESIPVPFAVKTWQDEDGFDGHRQTCFFSDDILPKDPARGCNVPHRYGARPTSKLDAAMQEEIKASGWTLSTVQKVVDQFVIHYDVCGTSRRCFEVLHDLRGLSVHFLLDVDGTLYQTLDLAHRARHAGTVNSRSVGIEIAHFGAYPENSEALEKYWDIDDDRILIKLPEHFHPPAGGPFGPANPTLARGRINGSNLVQPDYTEAQYETLTRLTDALIDIFPNMKRRVPRLADCTVNPNVLSPAALINFRGILAHWHITKHKIDPGPAFDWDRVVRDR